MRPVRGPVPELETGGVPEPVSDTVWNGCGAAHADRPRELGQLAGRAGGDDVARSHDLLEVAQRASGPDCVSTTLSAAGTADERDRDDHDGGDRARSLRDRRR